MVTDKGFYSGARVAGGLNVSLELTFIAFLTAFLIYILYVPGVLTSQDSVGSLHFTFAFSLGVAAHEQHIYQ
jgi:hypothetical protein